MAPASPSNGSAPGAATEPPSDPPVDLHRVAAAVRRSRVPVIACVLAVMGAVLLVSARAPARYQATARIAAEADTAAGPVDPNAMAARLAASRELVTAPSVLAVVAQRRPGETPRGLAGKLSATVESEAGILDVSATDTRPRVAAALANAAAAAFLERRAVGQRQAAERARGVLTAQLRETGTAPGVAAALRERIGDLAVSEATAGSDLRLVESADVPEQPYAPRPVRNAIFAGLAALLLAVLAAVARDRMRGRSDRGREIARQAGVPLLAVLPPSAGAPAQRRRPWRRRAHTDPGVELAALRAAVIVALPSDAQSTVLVCGIAGDEGAGRVAAGLLRSLRLASLDAVFVHADGSDGDRAAVRAAQRDGHRYVVVSGPTIAGSPELPQLAGQASAAILVGRVGQTAASTAAAAARLLRAFELDLLGLVLTTAGAEAGADAEAEWIDGAATRATPSRAGLWATVAPEVPAPPADKPSANGRGNGRRTTAI
jgi:capsular polysaccharide biosynthesis protein